MKQTFLAVFLAAFFIFIPVSNGYAHESFHWLQRVDKDRMLVVFYDTDTFKENVEQTFQLRLVELSNGKSIPFESAEISFKNEKNIHTLNAKPGENNDISFSYSFPSKGKYELKVELKDGSKKVISAQFPILAGEGITADPYLFFKNNALAVAGGLVVLISAAYFAGVKQAHIKLLRIVRREGKN